MGTIIDHRELNKRACEVINALEGLNPEESRLVLQTCLIPINIKLKELENIATKLTKIITKRLDDNKDLT